MERKGRRMVALLLIAAVVFTIAPIASGQEKPKAEGAAKEAEPFAITRMVAGTGVDNREPTGVAEKFPANTEKIYCFLEATNIPKDMEIYPFMVCRG